MNLKQKQLLFSLLSVINFACLYADIIEIDESNFNIVLNEAKRPVIIDFYADWCGPCKTMEPIFDAVADEWSEEYVFVRANVDNCKELAKECGIMSIPTCAVVQNRKMLGKAIGCLQEERLKEKIDEIVNGPKDLTNLSDEEKLKTLQVAMLERDIEKVKRTIDAGVDVNKKFEDGTSPVFLASTLGPQIYGDRAKEVVSMLVDAGASLTVEMPGAQDGKKTHVKESVAGMIASFEHQIKIYKDLDEFLIELERKE